MNRLLIVVVLGLVLTACSSAHPIFTTGNGPRQAHIVPPSPTALRFSTASNRKAAFEDVRKLIRIVVVPRGAREVAKVPQTAPSWFRSDATGAGSMPGVARTHRLWIVHAPLKSVVLFIQSHALPRPRPEARYRTPGNRIGSRPVRSYEFPPIPGRSWSRWLNVDIAALPDGTTAVFAQAGDQWIHTPPRSALLPAGVKRIDIVSRIGNRPPNVLVHVRGRYQVASIVSLLNGLGLVSGRYGCPLVLVGGPTVTLTFRSARGALLARAVLPDTLGDGVSGPCNPLQLTIGNRPALRLIGADLLRRVQRLLDIDLAPPLPRDVAACLRAHGWTVERTPEGITTSHARDSWHVTFHRTGKVTLSRRPVPLALARCLR